MAVLWPWAFRLPWLAALSWQLPMSAALKKTFISADFGVAESLGSTERRERLKARVVLDQRAKTLGGSRDVWLLEGMPRAPSAGALLLQSSSSEHKQEPGQEGPEDPPRPDNMEFQVQALEAAATIAGWLTDTAKAAAQQLNATGNNASDDDVARRVQAMLSTMGGAMESYRSSLGELMGALWMGVDSGATFKERYIWVDDWKKSVQEFVDIFTKSSQVIGAIRQEKPEDLKGGMCFVMGQALPALNNASNSFVVRLSIVVNFAKNNPEGVDVEPVRSILNTLPMAMRAMKVEGLFLEEGGVDEHICRSIVPLVNKRFGCGLELPWVTPPDATAKKSDEVKKAVQDELDKAVMRSMPWSPSNHVIVFWVVLAICTVMTFISFILCCPAAGAFITVPLWIVVEVIKRVLGLVLGIILAPLLICLGILGFKWESKKEAEEFEEEASKTGVPKGVLEQMSPLDRAALAKDPVATTIKAGVEGGVGGVVSHLQESAGGTAEDAVNGLQSGALSSLSQAASAAEGQGMAVVQEQAPSSSSAPHTPVENAFEALAEQPKKKEEHPMYEQLGLDPMAQMKKQYEKKRSDEKKK